MKYDAETLREEILEIFERNRQSPHAPFEEAHLLDYLIDPPAPAGRIKNSARGRRRYNQFFNDLELSFGICFSYSVLDRSYSLEQLLRITKQRIDKPRGNKMIIQQRVEENDTFFFEILFTGLLLLVFVYFKVHLVSALALLTYGGIIGGLFRSRRRYKRHNQQLYARIMWDVKKPR